MREQIKRLKSMHEAVVKSERASTNYYKLKSQMYRYALDLMRDAYDHEIRAEIYNECMGV